jgi:hypothetical protein
VFRDIFPPVDGQAAIDLERPRSVRELIGASVDLYFRVPILFLALAAVVVVPYELIVLLITGAGPLALGQKGILVSQLITLADYFLVIPLISALHAHAVREVGDGGRPRLVETFRRSLPALPAVALATGISWLGITFGFLLFIVPGCFWLAKWAVVAQTAALDGGGWTDALERSADLTEGERTHAFALVAVAGFIAFVPTLALWPVFGHRTTTVASFAIATAVQIIVRSFEALTAALLYFDLKARMGEPDKAPPTTSPADMERPPGWYVDSINPKRMRYWAADGKPGWSQTTAKTPKPLLRDWEERLKAASATATGDTAPDTRSIDPGVYTDEGRPQGWYVDPDKPWRMRYWHAGEHRKWSKQTTKTPTKIQAEWRDLRWRR